MNSANEALLFWGVRTKVQIRGTGRWFHDEGTDDDEMAVVLDRISYLPEGRYVKVILVILQVPNVYVLMLA
ncbi:unnamed protein product [Amaranthus hypochondriacus]